MLYDDNSSLESKMRPSILFKEECQGPSSKDSKIQNLDRREAPKSRLSKEQDRGQEKK